jgi:23S rRNA (pseudouridine1915-N3)-methyltransferase
MKVELWVIGKTSERYLAQGIELYQERLAHYLPFQLLTLPDVKQAAKLPPTLLKEKEADLVLSRLRADDYLVLLDERGRQMNSEAFAQWMEKCLHGGARRLVFLIGGAWGFAPALKARADFELSLSAMTFSHQMARLIFMEQLYRAMTISRNEPYHNA